MSHENKKHARISLLAKISGIFSVLLITAIMAVSIMNLNSIRTSSLETAKLMGRNKLMGDISIFEESIAREHGKLSLANGDLTDARGFSLKNDNTLVDQISAQLGVHATIFMKENYNYRRISTSIIDHAGKRAVDTFLGTESAAFSPIQAGQDFIGEAKILGANYLTVYRPIFSERGPAGSREVIGIMFIGIEIQTIEEYISNARESRIIEDIIQAVVVLFVAGLLTYLLTRSIIKPLKDVSLTLRDIAEGEGDLTHKIVIRSNDEVGDLALYFNKTLEKIKHLVASIREETVLLSETGDGLATDMNETAAAVNEITANIQNMKIRIQNQGETASETHTTMNELTGNIGKLDSHVKNQSSHIAQSSASIEEMVANINLVTNTLIKNNSNVKNLMEASEVGRTGLSEVVSDIREIARESEGLLEINSVMQNIASQTNLLSMNAAIEAAHAGDAGRGFAVVADEIRKLAENSSVQSKTISTVLKKIKESIDKITRSTDNVLSRFEAIDSSVRTVAEQEEAIRGSMEEQGIGSKQILTGIEEVNSITSKVESDSKEMLEEAQEVILESEKLDTVTQEINMGMVEMTAGVEQINLAINDINVISLRNREGIESLKKEISRFKID